nr:hypothetical protein [Tanacetum cinerariifolium]
MESDRWPQIYAGIQQHLQKIYNGKKAALKQRYWVPKEDGSYDLEGIRRAPGVAGTGMISQEMMRTAARMRRRRTIVRGCGIRFWSDPKNMALCAQNARNWAKSTVVCRQGSRTLTTLRDMQMQSSATQGYPSLIQTFFDTHTAGGIFLRDKDQRLYEEMVRLQGLGTYTDDQIMAMVYRGKQCRHILGHESKSGSGCDAGEDDESGDDEDVGEDANS